MSTAPSQHGKSADKRVLLISFFYAENGATGGFRWWHMAQGLRALGWEVDVVSASDTPAEATWQQLQVPPVRWIERGFMYATAPLRACLRTGRKLIARIRASVTGATVAAPAEQLTVPAPRASSELPSLRARLGRALDELIGHFQERLWARRVHSAVIASSSFRNYAAVITSSPPHEHQLAGIRIAETFGIPNIADFRDPWIIGVSEESGPPVWVYSELARSVETSIYRSSAVVVHNTEKARDLLSKLSPDACQRVSIANGFDSEPSVECPSTEHFEILFSGYVYPFMDLELLLEGFSLFLSRNAHARALARLRLLGVSSEHRGMSLASLIGKHGLGDVTEVLSRVSRAEAMRAQRRAAVLVVFDTPSGVVVPMKFYDYVSAGGDLLMFTRPGSALAEAAKLVEIEVTGELDRLEISRSLESSFQRWGAGNLRATNDPLGLHHRSRRTAQVDQLLRALIRDREDSYQAGA